MTVCLRAAADKVSGAIRCYAKGSFDLYCRNVRDLQRGDQERAVAVWLLGGLTIGAASMIPIYKGVEPLASSLIAYGLFHVVEPAVKQVVMNYGRGEQGEMAMIVD